ncbi:UNKNOWN [Stylonychia lemnae]|uniref:Uncharacterized protein n=1 Tax=Stylonychia lemnae TaxID=5949 RepID=A0A078AB73_STYLE|nr:UNKNOWN [Stylonychia lemnae]|eukprot:CDW79404.1 UNKNOWN [Stylonychia lemnae]
MSDPHQAKQDQTSPVNQSSKQFLQVSPTNNARSSSLSNTRPEDDPFNSSITVQDLLKPVGPGNYELPNLTGQKQIISTKQSPPSFSLSSRTDHNNRVIISKQHVQEIVGRDSPGVGSYNYDYSQLMNNFISKGGTSTELKAKYSFKKEKKFFQLTQNVVLKQNLPHYYDQDYKAKWNKQVGGFPKDERFKYARADKDLEERSPGPTTAQIRKDFSLPKIGIKKGMNKSFVIQKGESPYDNRDRFQDNSKIFFKELAGERQGRDSPGYVYNTTQTISQLGNRNNSFSFGKDTRKINEFKMEAPPPGVYNPIDLTLVRNKPSGGGFSKQKRNFDLVSFSEKHKIYAGQKFF